jgi:hypothetical protein
MQIYGRKKCHICKQHFKEGEVYRMVDDNSSIYKHVECPVKVKKVRA